MDCSDRYARIRDYFDRDAEEFAENRWLGSERARRDFAISREILFRELDLRDSHRVLEFGCGPGVWTSLLAERAASVVGVDLSPNMLSEARVRLGNRPNVRLVNSDLLNFEPDGLFDRVTLVRVLEYLRDKGEVLKTVSQLLVPGGRVVIITKPSKNIHVVKERLLGLLRAGNRQALAEVPIWRAQASEVERLGRQYGLFCLNIGPVLSRVFPSPLGKPLEWCFSHLPRAFSPCILFFCETFVITFERR